MRAGWMLAPVLLASGCAKLTCGEGTAEVDGVCTAAVDSEPPVECGPGTVRVGDQCEPEDPELACGTGTVRRGDECIAVGLQWVHLPLPEGTDAFVSQGHHGRLSHYGADVHAVDFTMPEGSPIAAAHAGVVLRVREDSDSGCGDPECADQANYVIVDHGNGTLGRYWHLEQGGALVEAGDRVERGEVIARSGNTGFSTAPHLHFEVTDLFLQSLPVRFHDLEDLGGTAFAGRALRSENAQVPSEEPPEISGCPADLYAFMGVILDEGTPCTAVEAGSTWSVSGVSHGDDREAVVARFQDGEWTYDCLGTDADGGFRADLTWTDGPGAYLMIGQGEGDCSFGQGWYHSPYVFTTP